MNVAKLVGLIRIACSIYEVTQKWINSCQVRSKSKCLSLGLAFLLIPAAAFADDGKMPDIQARYFHLAVAVLGLCLAGYWTVQAFGRASVSLANVPTFPRYMTRRKSYLLGTICFSIISLAIYSFLIYFHKAVLPIAGRFILPDYYEKLEFAMKQESTTYVAIVLFLTSVYLYLLRVESEWNVLLLLRSVIQSWMSIPRLANEIYLSTRFALQVPPASRSLVAGAGSVCPVESGDFEKDSQTIDRVWAEVSYMKWWLEHRLSRGSDAAFFEEPSFNWSSLKEEYKKAGREFAAYRAGNSGRDSSDVFQSVESLRCRFGRLVACYLVFKNGTEESLVKAAKAFGVDLSDEPTDNPLQYAVIYLVTLAVSTWVGVLACACLYDLVTAHTLGSTNFEPVVRWVGLSASNYGLPMFAILAARYFGWRANLDQSVSRLAFYCLAFVAAFCLAPFGLGIAQEIAQTSRAQLYNFLQLYSYDLRWAPGPAFICVYLLHYLDRQVDPRLPCVQDEGSSTLMRAVYALAFTMLVMGFSIVPVFELESPEGYVWVTAKLKVVVAGNMFIRTLALAVVAQNLPKTKSSDRSGRPDAPIGTTLAHA